VREAGGVLTASVLFSAREQEIGDWLRHRLLTFFPGWPMSRAPRRPHDPPHSVGLSA
jgi:hypothetical protein